MQRHAKAQYINNQQIKFNAQQNALNNRQQPNQNQQLITKETFEIKESNGYGVTKPYFQLLADTHYERETDNYTACRCRQSESGK
ncbi:MULTISPECIES: hypothetical protein [Raoultella]|uniref:Uncharacterized protein n=1 Tax=Raoultella lignicola TaxID=3040939 RepID=A0ABU9F6D8_9ENTR|nr:hypothetical protein [Raoultella sp. RIT712]